MLELYGSAGVYAGCDNASAILGSLELQCMCLLTLSAGTYCGGALCRKAAAAWMKWQRGMCLM